MKTQKIMISLIVVCFVLLFAVLTYGILTLGGSSETSATETAPSVPTAADSEPHSTSITTAPETEPSLTTSPQIPDTEPDSTPNTQAPADFPPVSGSFTSSLEVKLSMDVDWRTVSRTADEAEIEFTIVLNSYKIGVGARNNNYLKIGEESYSFSTPKINITESGKHETVLAVFTAKVPLTNGKGTFDASCSWNCKITYSGIYFDNIISEGVIEIK